MPVRIDPFQPLIETPTNLNSITTSGEYVIPNMPKHNRPVTPEHIYQVGDEIAIVDAETMRKIVEQSHHAVCGGFNNDMYKYAGTEGIITGSTSNQNGYHLKNGGGGYVWDKRFIQDRIEPEDTSDVPELNPNAFDQLFNQED